MYGWISLYPAVLGGPNRLNQSAKARLVIPHRFSDIGLLYPIVFILVQKKPSKSASIPCSSSSDYPERVIIVRARMAVPDSAQQVG